MAERTRRWAAVVAPVAGSLVLGLGGLGVGAMPTAADDVLSAAAAANGAGHTTMTWFKAGWDVDQCWIVLHTVDVGPDLKGENHYRIRVKGKKPDQAWKVIAKGQTSNGGMFVPDENCSIPAKKGEKFLRFRAVTPAQRGFVRTVSDTYKNTC